MSAGAAAALFLVVIASLTFGAMAHVALENRQTTQDNNGPGNDGFDDHESIPVADPGDFCALCGEPVADGEPVWLDEPTPATTTAQSTSERMERNVAYGAGEDVVVFGRRADMTAAIIDAVEDHDLIELEEKERVEEVYAVGRADPVHAVESVSGDRVCAVVKVHPPEPPKPDAEMHSECKRAIFGPNAEMQL